MLAISLSKDAIGRRYSRLEVLSFEGRDKHGNASFLCQCDCGNKKVISIVALNGNTKSCGCLQKENRIKHNMWNSSEYHSWNSMIQRCENPNTSKFNDYGGRGIKVCERWHKFENFYEDMGKKPSIDYSLERIDNNGNYELSNCKWASKEEQTRNTRIFVTNTSGVKGVSFDKSRNKWEAYIHIKGKKKNLGRFETLKEAADTRHEAELKYWKEEDDVEI